MTNPALDLQGAIYDALASDAALTNTLGGVFIYDDVPQKTPMPYVNFDNFDTRNWHTQTSRGHEHIITLHVWSDHHGRKQVQTIIGDLDAALDDRDLVLQSHHLVNLRVIFWSAMRDLDGKAWHGVIRLRAVTESL